MNDFETRVRSVNWKKYKGPDYYDPERPPEVLLALNRQTNPKDESRIYNDVLSVIGNNHGGTYYPAILDALDFIVEIADQVDNNISARTATEILIDWVNSFCPEIGSYSGHSSVEIEAFVKDRAKQFKDR